MKLAALLLVSSWLGAAQCLNRSLSSREGAVEPRASNGIPPSCYYIFETGVKFIQPQPEFGSPFKVLCDNEYEGGGWTVIQQRLNGWVNFYRGWKDYENGFGDMSGEFWLGLAKIHELTFSRHYELHVVLEDWEGTTATAKYGQFLVAGPKDQYRLQSLGNYSGTAGDSLSRGLGMKFTTLDADNDVLAGDNCARVYRGAWWYKDCHLSNLNGLYVRGLVLDYATSMCWQSFKGYYYGLKTSRMLIREVI